MTSESIVTSESAASNWSVIRRLLALSWHYRAGCVKVLLCQLTLLIAGLGALGLVGFGIDYVRYEVEPTMPPPRLPAGITLPASWTPLQTIFAIAAATLALAVFRAWLGYHYAVRLAILVERQIVVRLRSQVHDTLQRLSFQFFDANASSSIINRVTGDSRAVANFVNNVLIQGIVILLSLAVYFSYMVTIHLKLTVACLATTPLLWMTAAMFSRSVQPAYRRSRDLLDHLVLFVAETAQGIQPIKGFSREQDQFEGFVRANESVRDQQQAIFSRLSVYVPTIGFFTQLNIVILLAYGGYLVVEGSLPIGTGIIVFASLLQQFSTQISNMAQLANTIQQSLTGARRVFEILDAPITIGSPVNAVRLPRARGEVRFENVAFTYTGAAVVENVTFEVRAGECLALLGATGAGKTTILSLIPRFYDPTAGRVLVDGVDVRCLDLDDLRRNMGLVLQENFLFSSTVAANIAFGHPEASRDDIEHAAKVAAAHEFIKELPDGYDTLLGEGGKDLSGGQRQRIAIARALLLDPSILLLDDPTAAVDPDTESEIMEAVGNAMQERTTFLVSHRVSALRRADRILVLEQGRIVQIGSHAELMEVEGPYQQAVQLQLSE